MFSQVFFPDHMFSMSSETNGIVDASELIEVRFFLQLKVVLQVAESLISIYKLFSIQHRRLSNPALVQRSMGISMPKTKAGSHGRNFTLFYGGLDFTSPAREPPRLVREKEFKRSCSLYI